MTSSELISKYNLQSCIVEDRKEGIKSLLDNESISRKQMEDILLLLTAPSIKVANFNQGLRMFGDNS